jgi:hypothetical protein
MRIAMVGYALGRAMKYRTTSEIARRVYRALKTPADRDRTTDPILAFRFRDKGDRVILRCNKVPEISIKGQDQDPGEVKFFAYSELSQHSESEVIFRLRAEIDLIELYPRGAIHGMTFKDWGEFTRWLDGLDERGVAISMKLPCLVYEAVRGRKPSMQNFIVESIKKALRDSE